MIPNIEAFGIDKADKLGVAQAAIVLKHFLTILITRVCARKTITFNKVF